MANLKVEFQGLSEKEMIEMIPLILKIKRKRVRGESKVLYKSFNVHYRNDGIIYVFK